MSIPQLIIRFWSMSDFELRELQERIDAGILLAQRRLIERTRRDNGDLVVVRDGEVVRLTPDQLLIK